MSADEILSLSPLNFFSLNFPLYRGEKGSLGPKHVLPTTMLLSNERKLADVSASWSVEGLSWRIRAKGPGPEVELFIDTRDIKSASMTRFCHHFALSRTSKEEVRTFSSEDARPPIDTERLEVKAKNSKELEIFIPRDCLTGFSPGDMPRLGFSYRIHCQGLVQHFSALSEEYAFEHNPALWASASLVT